MIINLLQVVALTHTHTNKHTPLVSLTSSSWPQKSFSVFSSVLFHQQSSVPVLSSLARHAQRQKYLPDPTARRWPLSLACHDSSSITGGLVMDGQLLKENFIHGANGRRHRGCPDCCLACCRGKPKSLERGCCSSRKWSVWEPGNSWWVVAGMTEVGGSGNILN